MADAPLPPGTGALMSPDLIEVVGSASGITGVMVDARGRLCMAIAGVGVRATFSEPEQLQALSALLADVADHRIARAAEVAAEASADLDRIVASTTKERKSNA